MTTTSYSGNCHCGRFKYTAEFDQPITSASACSCSLCSKKAYLWVKPIAGPDGMTVLRGDDELGVYEFGPKSYKHKFCKTCGQSVYGSFALPDGSAMILINLRTIYGFDYSKLEVKLFDGANTFPPQYANPTLDGSDLEKTEDGQYVYDGACHCGAVAVKVKSQHLKGAKVMECNCSICGGMGALWIYPPRAAVTINGKLQKYTTPPLPYVKNHLFCNICGIHVANSLAEGEDVMPINMRILRGIRVEDCRVAKYDGYSEEPHYVVPE